MIASSQRPVRMIVSSVDWFFLADCLKLSVATFLLLLMMCVLYEDITWLRAIGKTRAALIANADLRDHLTVYTQTGEEWRLWQNALIVAAPVTELLNTLESTLLPSILTIFAPHIKEGMDGLNQLSQRLAQVESGLRGLSQAPLILTASDQFVRTPTRESVVLLAWACSDNIARLQNVDSELQWMTPLAEQVDSGFTAGVKFLEDNQQSISLLWLTQPVDSLIEWLRQQSLGVRTRSESLKHYQQMIQQDVQMMNTIITATINAQKTTAFFGNGVWYRLDDRCSYKCCTFLVCKSSPISRRDLSIYRAKKQSSVVK